ncbi:MAG: hypothetical protein AAB737_01880 [Patescibacteria group bacterium]
MTSSPGGHTPEVAIATVLAPVAGIVMPTTGLHIKQITISPLHDDVVDLASE